MSTAGRDTCLKHTWLSWPTMVFLPREGMSSFQCQVLLCPPGRDRLHSCEIRRSPQPKLWKIPLQKPWQPKQEPQSQRQPQSQQFPRSRQRITPLLPSPQPFSFPFLNLSAMDVFGPFDVYLPVFTAYEFLRMSPIDLFILIFCISCPDVLVDDLGM